MNHEGEELENRAARLADLYFRKHDYHQMAEYLADDVTWIGISKERICLTKDEVLKVMEMEMKVTDGIYEILQEWHYGMGVSERVGVTLAILKVRTPKKELYMTEIDTRISIVWRRQDGTGRPYIFINQLRMTGWQGLLHLTLRWLEIHIIRLVT